MIPIAPLLLLTAAQSPESEAQGRTVARQLLEQLVAEDDKVFHVRDGTGGDEVVEIRTRPRASDRRGICQRDRLQIERDRSGAIRKLESTHFFFIVAGSGGRPRWDLSGAALETSCAAAGTQTRWFEADDSFEAEAAVVGLLGLKEELLKHGPVAGTWGCRTRKRCPDPKAVGARIEPLDPGYVWDGGAADVQCPEGKYCVAVTLSHTDCDNWITQLRLDRSNGFRLHSARAGHQLGILHCNDAEVSPE